MSKLTAAFVRIANMNRALLLFSSILAIGAFPTSASTPGNMTIYANDSVQIAITDPQGRRIGYVDGTVQREIPEATYLDEQVKDDNPSIRGDHSVPTSHVLTIVSPQNALYTLTVTGMAAGSPNIEIYRYTEGGSPQVKQTLALPQLESGQTIVQTIRYSNLIGDLNGDGVVDCADLLIVRSSFGKKLGDVGFSPIADVNLDGVVDVRDLASVSQHLGGSVKCQ